MKTTGLFAFCLFTALGLSVASANPGDVFVDSGNGVIRISPDGTKNPFGTSLGGPRGLAFDPSHNLYVADVGSGNIVKFTPDQTRSIFSTNGGPHAIAFGSGGNLYGSYFTLGIEFTPPTGGGHGTNYAGGPAAWTYGLAFDQAGNYYVSEADNSIYKFAPESLVGTLFVSGLNQPVGLAFDRNGNLYEADFGSGNIYKFTPDGTQRTTFASGFVYPAGLVFDSAGNLLLADYFNKVYKISPDGLQRTSLATVPELGYWIAVEPGGTTAPAPVTIILPQVSDTNFTFSFTTVSNQSYTIQSNANLATTNWTFCASLTGNGSVFQFAMPLPGFAQRFFRVVEP